MKFLTNVISSLLLQGEHNFSCTRQDCCFLKGKPFFNLGKFSKNTKFFNFTETNTMSQIA